MLRWPKRRAARWLAPVFLILGVLVAAGVIGVFLLPHEAAAATSPPACEGRYAAGPPHGNAVIVEASAGEAERVAVTAWDADGRLVWNASIVGEGSAVWPLEVSGLARVVCQFAPGGGVADFFVWRGQVTVFVADSVGELITMAEEEFA